MQISVAYAESHPRKAVVEARVEGWTDDVLHDVLYPQVHRVR